MKGRVAAAGISAFLVAICGQPPASQADPLLTTDMIPGDISATTTFATEYIFRGISFTDEEPAIQGSFDYSVGVADAVDFYVSIWGSNIDTPEGQIEIDYFGGLAGEVPGLPGLGFDIGGIGYTFPGVPDELEFDFVEGYIGLSYDFGLAAASFYAWLSPDFGSGSGDAQYYSGGVDVPLPIGDATLTLHAGHQDIDENDVFGTPDYWDWQVALGVPLLGFDLSFAYIDTDMDEDECFGGTDLCDARFVFLASRSF